MKASELKTKSAEELATEMHDLLREQFNLRMQRATGQMAKTHRMKEIRRDIARIKTVLNDKAGDAK